ncbi:MAG TPA: hypothetical protein VI248_13860 [Kineosporiaceae bacterium]
MSRARHHPDSAKSGIGQGQRFFTPDALAILAGPEWALPHRTNTEQNVEPTHPLENGMDWNRRLNIGRTPVVGTLVALGVVGATLLAGPVASSQAAGGDYPNGGFCYQNKAGKQNIHRLYFSEPGYSSDSDYIFFSFITQKWDDSSNQYQDEGQATRVALNKRHMQSGGVYHNDANYFCKSTTEDPGISPHLGGEVYRYGEYTSTRTA